MEQDLRESSIPIDLMLYRNTRDNKTAHNINVKSGFGLYYGGSVDCKQYHIVL